MQVLTRRSLTSPVLVGAHGIGKTAIVQGLALRIAAGQVPQVFSNMELYVIGLAHIASSSGLWHSLSQGLSRKNFILIIDDIHTEPAAWQEGWTALKPFLMSGELKIIGTTIQDEYEKLRPFGLERRLTSIQVAEPTIPQTIEILSSWRQRDEGRHQISITDRALAAAASLAALRLPDRLPLKAINLLDETIALCELRGLFEVDEVLVAEATANILGLPRRAIAAVEGPRFAPTRVTGNNREIWGMA
jgi:ATP-dependent Clp protease ATP-binding subunit ClpC